MRRPGPFWAAATIPPMGKRLTQIATRTGDDGTTGLGDGTRVAKDHLRVQAMGDVDELNSNLGVLLAEPLPDEVRELLVVIQHELFNLGGELSIPGFELLKPRRWRGSTKRCPSQRCRGCRSSSCRPAARRRGDRACLPHGGAARRTCGGGAWRPRRRAAPGAAQYLNRLSDLLFVLARVLNRANLDGRGGDDVYWKSESWRAAQSDPRRARAKRQPTGL